MMRNRQLTTAVLLAAGCSAGMMDAKSADTAASGDLDGSWGADSAYDPAPSADDTGNDITDDVDVYDPETEDPFIRLEPASTATYVFVANEDRNTLTRIGVPALDVLTTEVGVTPRVVLTTPDSERTVTFNAGSDDVSIVDSATLQVTTVAVRDDFNQMVMSDDGRWVATYRDLAVDDEAEGTTEGLQSFNEVSFVDLDHATHWPMVVGFNPRQIQFARDGQLAVVVSDAYLAVVDLTQDEPSPVRIQVSDDLIDPPPAEEVVLAPDGSFAIVRQFQATDLVIVDLATSGVQRVDVGTNPTDLDVMPDKEHVVALARSSHQAWIYDMSDPLDDARVVNLPPGEYFGQVALSPDGTQALLFSSSTGAARFGHWDLETDEIVVRSIAKPIESVQISPDGGTAVVFHSLDDGTDVDRDSPFYGRWVITLLDLSDLFANPLVLESEPIGFSQSLDGEHGFFVMDGQPNLEVIDYDTLLFDEIELASNPAHVGVLPGTTWAYVSQEHELGRMSFYDTEGGSLQTITGFELNSGIEH